MSKKPGKGARPARATPPAREDSPELPRHDSPVTAQGWRASEPAASPLLDERSARTLRRLGEALPLIGVLAATVLAFTHGAALAVLVLAATAALVAIASIWASLQVLAGDRPENLDGAVQTMVSGGENEQKAFLLRALKDLEFERSLGKIGEDDYAELKRQYRARAKEVLQELDQKNASAREEAERMAAAWLASRGLSSAVASVALDAGETMAARDESDETAAREEPDAATMSNAEADASVDGAGSADEKRPICAACGADNESDARFCKKCGAVIERDQREASARSEG